MHDSARGKAGLARAGEAHGLSARRRADPDGGIGRPPGGVLPDAAFHELRGIPENIGRVLDIAMSASFALVAVHMLFEIVVVFIKRRPYREREK